MSEFLLNANPRELGSQSSLTGIRTGNRVPGVVYNKHQESKPIELDYNELAKVLSVAGTSSLVTLKLSGKETKVIVRECQYDPMSGRLSHVDFLAIDDKQIITTEVPLVFVGTSKAVREKGAKLNLKLERVTVKCLPADLPIKIEVDVSTLDDLGQAIYIKDLPVGDKVVILSDPNDPVVDVTEPKKMQAAEVVAPVATAVEGEAAVTPEGEAAAKAGEAKAEETKA